MYYLIIFFVAAAGGGAGGDIETLEFQTQASCQAAAAIINDDDTTPTAWSNIKAVCVKHD